MFAFSKVCVVMSLAVALAVPLLATTHCDSEPDCADDCACACHCGNIASCLSQVSGLTLTPASGHVQFATICSGRLSEPDIFRPPIPA